jgi:hypothetical protein
LAISAGFFVGDTLNFVNQNGIAGSYNVNTGVLILTGSASLANYQAALESITFSSTSGNPSDWDTNLSRTVSWTVTDGILSSNTITSTIVISAPPPTATPAGTSADMILRNGTNGDYAIFDIGDNAILGANALGQVGLEWQLAGLGGFYGTDTSDMLIRNSNTGAFDIYDVSNNAITSPAIQLGEVGIEWTVSGFGDFSGRSGETDMLMRNSYTGQFEVYDISNNAITSAVAMGQVGLEWQVAAFGDFSGNPGETDILMRRGGDGEFQVFDVSNNTITGSAFIGQVGMEWTVAGFGDCSGNRNETDMLMRNSNTGGFEVYDISHNTITSAASMGQVGLQWQVGGIAADPPAAAASAASTARFVQAMASFGASATITSMPGAVLGNPDTPPQTLLTMPP